MGILGINIFGQGIKIFFNPFSTILGCQERGYCMKRHHFLLFGAYCSVSSLSEKERRELDNMHILELINLSRFLFSIIFYQKYLYSSFHFEIILASHNEDM